MLNVRVVHTLASAGIPRTDWEEQGSMPLNSVVEHGAALASLPDLGSVRGPSVSRFANCTSFDSKRILYAELAGVVNGFGYCLLVEGQILRRFAGVAEQRTPLDEGEYLLEERACFESAIKSDGHTSFLVSQDGSVVERPAFSLGEDLVMSVAAPFFGGRYDRWPGDEPDVSMFEIR